MTKIEAKEFVNKVFDLIKKSESVKSIDVIYETLKIPSKNRMKGDFYPQINFKLDKTEIEKLFNQGLIHKETYSFKENISEKLTDPLTKLLYASAWKNGDLKKIKHIIRGVLKSDDIECEQDDALVFYQFGKYLTKQVGQPIIDQHVIRAFAIYKSSDAREVEKLQKLEKLNKSHKSLINDYIKWLQSAELTSEIKSIPDYSYVIDKLLYATGKTIKLKKPTQKKNTVISN